MCFYNEFIIRTLFYFFLSSVQLRDKMNDLYRRLIDYYRRKTSQKKNDLMFKI